MFDVSTAQVKLKFLFPFSSEDDDDDGGSCVLPLSRRTQNGEMGGMRLIINPTARI